MADCGNNTENDIDADAAIADRIAMLGLHIQGVHQPGPPPQPDQQPTVAVQQPLQHTERIQKPNLTLVDGEVSEER